MERFVQIFYYMTSIPLKTLVKAKKNLYEKKDRHHAGLFPINIE